MGCVGGGGVGGGGGGGGGMCITVLGFIDLEKVSLVLLN